jgi:GNAT superfamily N-acetyltransferase
MSVDVVAGYRPGAIGRVTALHGTYYAEHWGFGLVFESQVATGLCEFLGRLDANRDGFWLALSGGAIVGSVALDGGGGEGARLRWFVVEPGSQRRGIGRRLFAEALAFARAAGHRQVYLHTFAGLDAARHLYEAFGFRLAEEKVGSQWGRPVPEQRFELNLD